ncbi:SDR family oxidoreductase [Pelagicoccus sp. SDUM812003]|uniref:SDR family oxidoreductase n=1 Tax=Pelagicoccus sp. SDUM812003 TaxID=3041267 RepID=UPI00280ED348|nr:SDR family oxidoreductase [Pelagicoccus sp. SDUM812003]MDQ8203400.1 SDR family oxidoreductase [Pelagicoccus sp. SDUM812003]
MSLTIENTVAFVTGSNRGIGRSIVQELLNRGVKKVYAAARNTDGVADFVSQYADRVVAVKLDVTDPEQVAAAASQAEDVTLFINNAGVLGSTDLFGGDLSAARHEFEVNYWGVLYTTRAFAPILKANGGGSLATVSSVAGLSNFPAIPTYSDSKAAVHSLISGSRLLLAAQGTKVIGIYPGPVETDIIKDMEMTLPTTSPADVAVAIVDGIEAGTEDIFPDAFAQNYAEPYQAGHRALENRIAAMLQQPA